MPKKPARKFSDIFAKYKTYDTAAGLGSVADWRSQWEEMSSGDAHQLVDSTEPWGLLGLTACPTTMAQLRTAYHRRMQEVHPDHGGSTESARLVIAAYVLLKEAFSN